MQNRFVLGLALAVGLAVALPSGGAEAAVQEEEERCTCPEGLSFSWLGDGLGDFSVWRFPRARIGVSLGGESQEQYDDLGAYVQGVQEGSPAEEAGLQEGDVITSVGGHNLLDPLSGNRERRMDEDGSLPLQRLLALAADWEPEEEVEVTYERNGDSRTVMIQTEESDGFDMEALRGRLDGLGDRIRVLAPRLRERSWQLQDRERERADDLRRRRAPVISFRGGEGSDFAFGWSDGMDLTLSELNPDLGRYFGTESGVLVLEVGEGSDLPLQSGDVILSIGGREVDSPRDVRRIVRSYDADEPYVLEVMRDGSRIELDVTN